jgi:adenylosuccinate lyase
MERYRNVEALRPIFSEFARCTAAYWSSALVAGVTDRQLSPKSRRLDRVARPSLMTLADGFALQDAERIKTIERTTNHDVKAVEYFLKERIGEHAELSKAKEFVHFACTSEDINNLAYALMLRDARDIVLLPALDKLLATLKQMAHALAAQSMLARTHGQTASPTTLGKEIANVVARLQRQRAQIAAVALSGKINGAVGNYNAHVVAYPEVDWPALAQRFVESLGLDFNPYTTQIEPHDGVAESATRSAARTTILIDFCRDIWGYISLGYFRQELKARRSRLVDDAAQGQPDRLRERRRQPRHRQRAVRSTFAEKLPISRWQRDLTDSTVSARARERRSGIRR